MKPYDPKKIEKKWQKTWARKKIYATPGKLKGPKAYVLDMFPYPSGEGLHVGHPKGYIATDVYSRFKRMNGFGILHPMGWDAFGLPAENYAIKNKVHPRVAVDRNIKRFKEQLEMIGFDYDWKREIDTTDPKYYKWTQWIFLQMYKRGLAYQSFEPINWCPSCQTGLANEDLEDGRCERCGSIVEKRPMRQWVLKITNYADRLLEGLNEVEWPEYIKESQRNWIGKSEGAELSFDIEDKRHYVILHGYKGGPDRNFLPWLKAELERRGNTVETPALPNTDKPVVMEQVEHVLKTCRFDENTILVGHSLGTVVAMKVAEYLKKPLAKLVLAAGFIAPDFKDKKKRPFEKTFDWTFDFEAIKRNAKDIVLLRDPNDDAVSHKQVDAVQDAIGGSIRDVAGEKAHYRSEKEPAVLEACFDSIKVFTTRADTLFGVTYIVLAPEHPLVQKLKLQIKNWPDVEKYLAEAKKKDEIERTAEGKEKTGVELKGVCAVNPATGEGVPVWVADYVLAQYGTGAVMAVPAHDDRDYAFAVKYKLPIREVVIERMVDKTNPHVPGKQTVYRDAVIVAVRDPKTDRYLCLKWKKQPWTTFVMGGIEKGEDPVQAALREIREETGYKNVRLVRKLRDAQSEFFAAHKDVNRVAHTRNMIFELANDEREEISAEENDTHELVWRSVAEIREKGMTHSEMPIFFDWFDGRASAAYTGTGVLIDSESFSGQSSEEARRNIAEKFGKLTVTYKLRDWVFSRQRYWGEPIPIIHCEKCGVVPVPEKDLPVKLPNVKKYEPTGTGESPLAAMPKWVNVKCPSCKGKAKRETNTMPQWAGSSWYHLRYADPKNSKAPVGKKEEKYWLPVDMYVGGAEHATRHLIYARFWHKFLFDIGAVAHGEPYRRLQNVGLILAEDGRKMSKRWGNVVNPDDVVRDLGADTLRTYEMFMGPFNQAIAWSTDNMIGARRFLERVWRISDKVSKGIDIKEIDGLMHRTIRKVGEDIDAFKFNTALSQLMILLNALEKLEAVPLAAWEAYLKLLAPFAPHMTDELWASLGRKKSIHTEAWPEFDSAKIKAEAVTIVVQVNGKVRSEFEAAADIAEADAVKIAESLPDVKKWTEGKQVKKVVYVRGRLVNIVVA